MKLSVELWVDKVKPFGDESEHLFEESVICYKNGAYTSAFLMSYLAFRTAVRYRILKCTYRPTKYTKEEIWTNNISEPLKNDDSWEDALDKILEATAENIKAIIYYENRDKATNELKYWRNVRNACAHAKKATIDSSTVESFWNYLRDNMGKFYVLGGKEYLVEKLLDNYKYRKIDVSISQEKELLIHDVKVVYSDPSEFFQEFFVKLGGTVNVHDNNIDFWNDLINSSYEEIQVGIVKELMKDDFMFYSFYSHFPKILKLAIAIDARFTWDVLSKWLAETVTWAITSNQIFWNMLCTALANNKDSIDIQKVVKRLDLELIDGITLNEAQLALLHNCNFFNQVVLTSGKYIFDVDYNSILDNNGRKEREVLQWFDYVTWDKPFLTKMDYTLRDIKQQIQKMSGKHYGGMEIKRKNHYEAIIKANSKKLLTIPEEIIGSFEHIKEILA